MFSGHWPLATAQCVKEAPRPSKLARPELSEADLLLNQKLTSPSLCSRLLLKGMCSFYYLLCISVLLTCVLGFMGVPDAYRSQTRARISWDWNYRQL